MLFLVLNYNYYVLNSYDTSYLSTSSFARREVHILNMDNYVTENGYRKYLTKDITAKE